MSTVEELFQKGRHLLQSVAAEPSIEAKVLLLKSACLSEEQFFASPQKRLSRKEESAFFRLIDRRLSGVPLTYLTRAKEFWSLPLKILPGVFIPRPETELIVEKVLELSSGKEETIIDIGTGSGNIALALAKELPRARIFATDISARALRLAKFNALEHNADRIVFVQGNLFSALKGLKLARELRPATTALKSLNLEAKCDFIVSNPPYVSAGDWETLSRKTGTVLPEKKMEKKMGTVLRENRPHLSHEPRRALVPGKTGFEFIRRLIKGSPTYLKPGGYLFFEIGQGQREGALSLFDQRWSEIECFEDLRGIPRVVKARKI